MNKKAEERTSMSALIQVLVAIIITIALFVLIFKLYPLLSTPTCENKDSFNQISQLLEEMDSGKIQQQEIFFNNKNCKLVTFSAQQGYNNKINPPEKHPNSNAYICLCYIKENNCKNAECKGLYIIKQINKEQFTTIGQQNYLFLMFTKEGDILKINQNEQKSATPNT